MENTYTWNLGMEKYLKTLLSTKDKHLLLKFPIILRCCHMANLYITTQMFAVKAAEILKRKKEPVKKNKRPEETNIMTK